jgi:Methyltransferase domain
MRQRADFVNEHIRREILIDVGIGSGAFIERRNAAVPHSTFGYDINPAGVAWLNRRGLWFNPYHTAVPAMSLWDVLEHIRDFRPLLANAQKWLFLALPIFADRQHALRSKHYRPAEHVWYFTRAGLLAAMHHLGFELVTESEMEILAGREDIGAYAFKRRAA